VIENLLQVEGILDIDNVRGGNGALLDPTKNGRRRPADRSRARGRPALSAERACPDTNRTRPARLFRW
jgi:hypothetical protein